jgi:hypothetical protein
MLKRLGTLALAGTAVAGMALWIAPRALGANDPDAGGLTVHEWGTFTSIAGPDGQAVQWRPLTGPSDLPCFVSVQNTNNLKVNLVAGIPGIKATVRMETPVLYFYSPQEVTVRARVDFPQGVITEWYPSAKAPVAQLFLPLASARGGIEWIDVKVVPAAKASFPIDSSGSHYYAARETDAAPLQVGGQQEKFLFYRGLGGFAPLVGATIGRDGSIAVTQTRDRAIDTLILFERRGSRFGYRIVRAGGRDVAIERPSLTGSIDSLRNELRGVLTAQGLYPREAAAMVETWRDSWFEEGARLFYVLPKAAVDALLPLRIDPKPASVTRVFVGRLEIVTPQIETEVAQAIRAGDQAVLRKYGRFLEPISRMIEPTLSATHDERKIAEAARMVASRQASPAACPAPGSAKPTAPSPPSIQ